MPTFEDQAEAQAPARPKKDGFNLGIQIKVAEGQSFADIIEKAEQLGEVQSLNLHPRLDYGDDYLY